MQPEPVYTQDGSPILLNPGLNATYHSRFGAIREGLAINYSAIENTRSQPLLPTSSTIPDTSTLIKKMRSSACTAVPGSSRSR